VLGVSEHEEKGAKIYNKDRDPNEDTEYVRLLLEQYKLYVQMADKISDRRADANKFFISLLTGLLALLSAVVALRTPATIQSAVLFTVAILGIVLCIIWWFIIHSYKQLNTGKFKVVHEMEKKLPYACYDREWEVLGRGEDRAKYLPLTHVEQYVPLLFKVPFVVLLIAAAYLLFH